MDAGLAVSELLTSPLCLFCAAVIVLGICLYIRLCYLPFQVLKKNGIPGPTPSPFYGSYKRILEMGTMKYMEQQHKKYGDMVGIYLGTHPYISVTDLELIKLITIKDSDFFINRPPFPNMTGRRPGLLFMRDEEWRTARRTLTPTFSAFKMKAMTPLIKSSVESLVDVLQQHADSNKSVEIFKIFSSFTMETVLATAFGRVVDIQRGESSQLTEAAAAIFDGGHEDKKTSPRFLITLLSNAPWLAPILSHLFKGSKRRRGFDVLHDTAVLLIQQRRAEPEVGKYKDLLQLMIEATVEESDSSQKTSSKKILSDEEISRHCITFMLAGYETTANALSYTAYLMALNPHIQEKMQEEVDKYFQEKPDVSAYEAAQDLEYVDMVLHESLRLYPPAPVFPRECGRAYTYKGITIPKGTGIQIPGYLLHMKSEYWKEPEKFDPLRFSAAEKAQRPQHCYMPFGSGPRSCIGMRFALLEAKIALIELFKKYSFLRAPDTEVPLKTVLGATMSPKNGIYLEIITRKKL